MKGKATIIGVDGKIVDHELTKVPSLQDLQRWVGGYIERIPYWDTYFGERCIVFANEEGKMRNLPLNVRATKMWQITIAPRPVYPLVGPIAIITGDKGIMNNL